MKSPLILALLATATPALAASDSGVPTVELDPVPVIELAAPAVLYGPPAPISFVDAEGPAIVQPEAALPRIDDRPMREARTLANRLATMPDEAYGTVAGFVADGALTCMVVADGGREANPLVATFVGKRPNCGKMAAFTAAKSALYLAGISFLQDVDPGAARNAARITLVVQTGVVGYNVGVALKVKL